MGNTLQKKKTETAKNEASNFETSLFVVVSFSSVSGFFSNVTAIRRFKVDCHANVYNAIELFAKKMGKNEHEDIVNG